LGAWLEEEERELNRPSAGTFTEEELRMLGIVLTDWRPSPADMREVEILGREHVVLIYQRAGEGVNVKVGWMHAVCNLLPCVKIAFEVLRPEDAVGAVQMQRYLRCMCNDLPDDYMCIMQVVVDELLDWSKVIKG
jgi:hypothetical protein